MSNIVSITVTIGNLEELDKIINWLRKQVIRLVDTFGIYEYLIEIKYKED